ncbi:MAG: hypothetical protein Q7R52_02560 [archaeon]|nr:hypothetical protein [archaeon]
MKNCTCDCHNEPCHYERTHREDKKSEWVQIPEKGFEVQRERHSLGIAFEDVKVPEGCELLTLDDVDWIIQSKYAKQLGFCMQEKYWEEYIKQPLGVNEGKRSAWVCYNDIYDYFNLGVNYYLNDSSGNRWVRFKREIKKVKK